MRIPQILIWALVVKLLIASLFFHPDLKDIHLRVSFLSTSGVFNIYDYLKTNEVTKVNAPDFVYPPLTYFFLGAYQFLAQPILGDKFYDWLFDFSGLSAGADYIYRYILILKLPYFVFDFLIGFLLFRIVPLERKKLVLFLWLFNPLNLYAIYAIGQFDIIPSFFAFFALYLWDRKSYLLSGVTLGLAASFKTYPLLLLPFILITKAGLKNKLIYLTVALGIYGLTILPFLHSENFRVDVLFSGLSQRIFEPHIPAGFTSISIFPILYIALLLISLKYQNRPLWYYFLSILLITLALIKFHPQWIVWVTPFLTLALATHTGLIKPTLLLILSYFLIFIFFGDRFLIMGLLSPVSLEFLEIPPITQRVGLNANLYLNLSRLLFAFAGLLIIVRIFLKKP